MSPSNATLVTVVDNFSLTEKEVPMLEHWESIGAPRRILLLRPHQGIEIVLTGVLRRNKASGAERPKFTLVPQKA